MEHETRVAETELLIRPVAEHDNGTLAELLWDVWDVM